MVPAVLVLSNTARHAYSLLNLGNQIINVHIPRKRRIQNNPEFFIFRNAIKLT